MNTLSDTDYPMRRKARIGVLASLLIVILCGNMQGQQQSVPVLYHSDYSEKLAWYRNLVVQYPDSVIALLLPELQDYLDSPVPDIAGRALYFVGLSYYFKGQYILSNYYYQEVLQLDTDLVSDDLREAIHNNKGVNYDILSLFDRSVIHYQESSRIARRQNNELGVAQTDLNVAILKYKMGRLNEAIEITQKVLGVFEVLDNKFNIALASMNLGGYLIQEGNQEGFQHLERARILFYEYGADRNIANVYYHMAYYYAATDNPEYRSIDTSITYAERALAKLPPHTFSDVRLKTLNLLIRLYDMNGRTDDALGLVMAIQTSIADGLITSLSHIEDFWEIAIRLYSRLNRGDDIAILLDRKDAFEAAMTAQLYSPLVMQYNTVASLSPSYAASIAKDMPFLVDGFTNKTIFPYVLFSVLSFLSFLAFYLIMHQNWQNVETGTEKLNYLVKRINDRAQVSEDHFGTVDGYKSAPDKLFTRIETYLLEDDLYLRDHVNREDVARKLFTNVKYVTHAIRRNTNLSFSEYINYLRISYAVRLLQSGDSSITMSDLCVRCGYVSEATFYRNFKAIVGVSPTKFRDVAKSGVVMAEAMPIKIKMTKKTAG